MIRNFLEKDKESVQTIGSSLESFDINKCSDLDEIKVFTEDDRIIGFIVYRVSFEVIDILYIVVDEEYRNMQIGTRLVESLYNIEGVSKIMLEVSEENKIAINFYKKLGFNEVRHIKNYYDGKVDAIAMEKVIK